MTSAAIVRETSSAASAALTLAGTLMCGCAASADVDLTSPLRLSSGTGACPAGVHRLRRILPRSRHLPRASTEGSSTRNLNKTGVRLWTDSSLDQNREVEWAVRPLWTQVLMGSRSPGQTTTSGCSSHLASREVGNCWCSSTAGVSGSNLK